MQTMSRNFEPAPSSRRSTAVTSRKYQANSQFIERLSNDAVRRQYIVELCSKERSGIPFGFGSLVETIAERYLAAGYQLKEVQNASRRTGDTTGAAVSRPLPIALPPTLTSTMFLSNPMPQRHMNPMPTTSVAPFPSTVPEPMNLESIAKLREELHAYLRERQSDRSNRHDS